MNTEQWYSSLVDGFIFKRRRFRTERRQHYRTSTMIVHFCHVACGMDGFGVRLGLERELGQGALKCVDLMLCGYFEKKYLRWHNPDSECEEK